MTQIKKPAWSPYAAGALLGVVSILALWTQDQLLGASGAFENVAGLAGAVSSTIGESIYFRFVMPPGITWQVVLLLGVFLGALASSRVSGSFTWRHVPPGWERVWGTGRWKRWLIVFLGGIILEYGAGIAGGCTSGLAISGSLQLAPAGFVFIAGLFASGIATSMVLHRREK
ncbi:hypothetical protein SY88_18415 [Clostridiales bacterium PH28_bin88]|nr:hypothetical protein SY88_18415 [Clostridiales bacterium PH28_bin88]